MITRVKLTQMPVHYIVAIDFACIFGTPFFSRTKNVPTRIVLIITVYIELDFSKNIESG